MRILIALSRFPYPTLKGDKLRAYYLIQELSKYNEIHLFCVSDEPITSEMEEALKPYCKTITVQTISSLQIGLNIFKNIFSSLPFQVAYFTSKAFRLKISAVIREKKIDLVYVQMIRMAENIPFEILKAEKIPVYLDFMDCLSAGMQKRINSPNYKFSYLAQIEAGRLVKYEEKMGQYFNGFSIISEADAKRITPVVKKKIDIVPNGISEDFLNFKNVNSFSSKIDVIFTGNLSYPPNIEASVFLIKQIAPLVWKAKPDTIFYLVGVDPHEDILKLTKLNPQRVIVTGYVADIRPYLKAAKVFASPLFSGSGLQNKLLEAMAIGIPVITTPLPHQSLGGVANQDLFIASDAKEFAVNILNILDQKVNSQVIIKNAQTYVQKNFNWAYWGQKLHDILLHTLQNENLPKN